MRRLAGQLGVSQPVLYSVFAGRQALVDAVALAGFGDLATALEAADASPRARMEAYLRFAAAHPRVYEAMFMLPTSLAFAVQDPPAPLQRAFRSIHDAFPEADETRVEVVWATWHGLASLEAGGRLRVNAADARLDLAQRMFSDAPRTR